MIFIKKWCNSVLMPRGCISNNVLYTRKFCAIIMIGMIYKKCNKTCSISTNLQFHVDVKTCIVLIVCAILTFGTLFCMQDCPRKCSCIRYCIISMYSGLYCCMRYFIGMVAL